MDQTDLLTQTLDFGPSSLTESSLKLFFDYTPPLLFRGLRPMPPTPIESSDQTLQDMLCEQVLIGVTIFGA